MSVSSCIDWRRRARWLAGSGSLLVLTAVAATQGDARRGAVKVDREGCLECHAPQRPGPEAGARESAFAPRLEGQRSDYLQRQLRAFRSGSRRSDQMQIMAGGLDDADAADITAWFAAQPPPPAMWRDTPAALIFRSGDAARGLPACAACHGDAAQGDTLPQGSAPRLAGQDALYLQRQLLAFAQTERRHEPDGVMNRVAASLSQAEIETLADFLAAP
jgi:cytochrome c553